MLSVSATHSEFNGLISLRQCSDNCATTCSLHKCTYLHETIASALELKDDRLIKVN
jgi:hypothetical protein